MTTTQEFLGLNLADYTIIAVVFVSMLISLMRGFLKELLSLVIWVVGFWIALKLYNGVAVILEPHIVSAGIRMMVSFGGVFLLVLILGTLFGYLFSFIITKSGLSGPDRVLGMVFGSARGILLVAVVLLLVSSTAFVQDEWWKKSILIPHFQVLIDWLRVFLPQKMTDIVNVIPRG